MKRSIVWLLLIAMLPCLLGSVSAQEPEKPLYLTVSSITFSVVGEQEDIYLGLAPREQVRWQSDDPGIVSVENGVLTATGVGTTTIHARYADQELTCTAGCLAQTREALDALEYRVLCQPKRLLPQVELNEPCTYFDNAALVGDSIAYMMMQVESPGDYLGNILFLARGGTSLYGFVNRMKNVYYQGQEMNLEDAIAQSRVERVYVLIGSTDMGVDSQRDAFFDNWDIMLSRIREKSPEVEIVMISNIPRYDLRSDQVWALRAYNECIAEYNEKLRTYAAENGCLFLDLCAYIEDHCGRMAESYNLDGFHLSEEGYRVWMKVMRYYARYEREGGTLS